MEPLTALNVGPVRVVIAEGQGLLRAGFLLLLEGQDGIVVAAETATLEEGVAATQATDADVVLIDLDLPGGGGVEAAHRIIDGRPDSGATRIVMLMTTQSDEAVLGALRAGATGLLLKDTDPDELVN